jgi:hypothetical protein
MNTIARIATTARLNMASTATFAQSSGEIATYDQGNMHAGDNYPIRPQKNSIQSRVDVVAAMTIAQHDDAAPLYSGAQRTATMES